MNCEIEWNSLTLKDWQNKFASLRRSNILQSYDFAMSSYSTEGQRPKWGLIHINGCAAGMVQIAEASLLKGLFHVIILDRGPLWFNTNQEEQKTAAFLSELNQLYPKRFGRKRRIIPYLENTETTRQMVIECGFTPQPDSRYETIWLDLTQSREVLNANLHPKWRNALAKARRQSLRFEIDPLGATLPNFLTSYKHDITQKEYTNIDPKLVPRLFQNFSQNAACLLCHIYHDTDILASALILCHGGSATYQIGHVNKDGRGVNANYLLLWSIIEELKSRGIKDFDLGGVNPYSAKQIEHFKERMGGQKVNYLGIYS